MISKEIEIEKEQTPKMKWKFERHDYCKTKE